MSFYEQALARIDQGREGGNEGLPMGFDRLVKYVPNIQRGTYYLVGASTGVGKCLAPGTKVIMFSGKLKKVEDIQVGDQLMGPDSTPRNVLALGSGVDQMYWVRQNKGIDYKVNSHHIVSLSKRNRGLRKACVVNLPIAELLTQSPKFFHEHKGWKAEGVNFPEADVSLDPYFLGAWLGDGHSDGPSITNIDKELNSYVQAFAIANGCYIRHEGITSNITSGWNKKVAMLDDEGAVGMEFESVTAAGLYAGVPASNISRSSRLGYLAGGYAWRVTKAKNPILNLLQQLSLVNNKHIPDSYLYNSRTIRLQVLAGIIDTDGHNCGTCYEVTQKNKRLSEDIVYLSRSLGFYTTIREKTATMRRGDGSMYSCVVHRIFISGNKLHEIPCLVPRKKAGISTRITDALVTGIKIEKAEVGLYYGFQLDGDSLFLLEDFTVTHNTAFTDQAFLYEPFEYLMNLGEETDIELDIDYFSFEIDTATKVIKGASRRLYQKYGIIADVNFILSKGKNRISQEVYDKYVEQREYFDVLEKHLTVFDMPQNPTGIQKYLHNKANEHGTSYLKEVTTLDDHGKPTTLKVFDRYVPKNPKRYHIAIIDHISLMKEERGFMLKENIDKMSQYFIQLRNQFSIIPVVVQQLSFDNFSSDRSKLKKFTPTLGDFGDSRYTTRDANVVLSLFNPLSLELPKFMDGPGNPGYNITALGDNFRSCEILKGRDGGIGTRIGLQYVGATGVMKELPRPQDMTDADYRRVLAFK